MTPNRVRASLLTVAVFIAVAAFVLWPVCVPLSSEQAAALQPPLSERKDTYLWGRISSSIARQSSGARVVIFTGSMRARRPIDRVTQPWVDMP